jgi:hypothetical protein
MSYFFSTLHPPHFILGYHLLSFFHLQFFPLISPRSSSFLSPPSSPPYLLLLFLLTPFPSPPGLQRLKVKNQSNSHQGPVDRAEGDVDSAITKRVIGGLTPLSQSLSVCSLATTSYLSSPPLFNPKFLICYFGNSFFLLLDEFVLLLNIQPCISPTCDDHHNLPLTCTFLLSHTLSSGSQVKIAAKGTYYRTPQPWNSSATALPLPSPPVRHPLRPVLLI